MKHCYPCLRTFVTYVPGLYKSLALGLTTSAAPQLDRSSLSYPLTRWY